MADARPIDIVAAAAQLGMRPDGLVARWVTLRQSGATFSENSLRRLEFTEQDVDLLRDGGSNGTAS